MATTKYAIVAAPDLDVVVDACRTFGSDLTMVEFTVTDADGSQPPMRRVERGGIMSVKSETVSQRRISLELFIPIHPTDTHPRKNATATINYGAGTGQLVIEID